MKITEYSPVNKAGAASRKKEASSASGGGFLGLLGASEVESAQGPAATADILPPDSMNALLSLQEIPEDELRRRKAVRESEETLETLETLRIALLTGSVPERLLGTLTHVVQQQKSRVEDPRLIAIIEDIELRAAVELAKLERASAPR